MGTQGRWPPYVLLPSAPDEGRPSPEIIEAVPEAEGADWFDAFDCGKLRILNVWPLDQVVKNLLVPLGALLTRADDLKQLTDKDTGEWIAMSRRIARELPYGGTLSADIGAVADRLEHMRETFRVHLKPGFQVRGMKHEHVMRINHLVFTLDRLLKTANDLEPIYADFRKGGNTGPEYLRFELAGVWERLLGPLGVDAKTASDDAMRERLKRFRENIQPGHEDAIVRDVLADVLARGSFLPDGRLRRSETVPPR